MQFAATILLLVALFFAMTVKSKQTVNIILIAAIATAALLIISYTPPHRIIGGNDRYMKMELMDPKHNMREIAKQLILIEDHMAHKHKRCVDCLTKHYLMVEGLLEETITLDKTGEHIDEVNTAITTIKPVMMSIIEKIKNSTIADKDYQEACQVVRSIRKEIALKYVLYI